MPKLSVAEAALAHNIVEPAIRPYAGSQAAAAAEAAVAAIRASADKKPKWHVRLVGTVIAALGLVIVVGLLAWAGVAIWSEVLGL